MSSPILGSRERAKVKERLAALERHFVNLRQDLLTDLKSELGKGDGQNMEVVEGTSRIEEYDTVELYQEQKNTENMKQNIDKEVSKMYSSLKQDLETNLRNELIAEQQVLFLKMKEELSVRMRKEMDKMKKQVCSRGTQVEPGDLPLELSSDGQLEDSVSLLA